MGRYRQELTGVLACLVGVVVYVFAVGPDWGEQLIARGYSLFTPSQVQGAHPVVMINGAPGGTDLEDWGLKMVFLDGLQVERVWRRGSGQQQELVGAQGLEEIIGEARVQLAFLYRFRDAREGERVRQILIEQGVGSLGKTKREVEWMMGAFPRKRGKIVITREQYAK